MKHLMKFVFLILITSLLTNVHADSSFPHRESFSQVSVIELAELEAEYESVFIIDVRSRLEFNALHMTRAINIPMSTRGFELEAKSLVPAGAKIVTYCNGHSCKKSYEASLRLEKVGLSNVYAFDAGIFDWTRANPDKSALLGNSPVDLDELISGNKLEQHLLNYDDFMAQSKSSKSLLIDVRDHFQKRKNKRLKGARFIPLDKFHSWLISNKEADKTLYIFDARGKQIRWLQYYLESQDRKNYFFLKGGLNTGS